jgi:hypothetical protein
MAQLKSPPVEGKNGGDGRAPLVVRATGGWHPLLYQGIEICFRNLARATATGGHADHSCEHKASVIIFRQTSGHTCMSRIIQ